MEEGATGPNGSPTPSDEALQERSPSPEGGAPEVVEFEVGEVVLVRNEDNLLQERKIAEISTRCHKRQYQKVYRLQPLEGMRKGSNKEFLEASRILKPTPTLIDEMKEAMSSLESGRYDRGRGDDESARRPQMKAGTSRDPSWWEYASDACMDLDKGKGVALEDIVRHIDNELFPNQNRTCLADVETALTASVKSGHIFLSSEGLYTLAPDARRPRLKRRAGGARRASQDRAEDDDDDATSTGSGPTSSVGRGYAGPRGGMPYGRPPSFGPPGGMSMPGGKGMGKMSSYGYDPAMMSAWQAYPGGPRGPAPYYPPQPGMGGKPEYGTGAFRPGGARDSLNSLRNAEEGPMGMGGPSDFRGYFPPGLGGAPGMRYSPTMDPYGRPSGEAMYRYPPPPSSMGMPGAYDRDMLGRSSSGGGGSFRLPGVVYDQMGFPQGSVGPNGLLEQSRVLPPEDYTRMATPGAPSAGSVLVGSLAAAVMNGPAGLNYDDDDVDDDGQRLSHQEAARRQATAFMRNRGGAEEDVFGRRISDSYDSKVNDNDDEQTKQYKRSCYELKVLRKKIGVGMDIVQKLKSDRKLLYADLNDAERKLANRQTRWETKEQKVAEMGMVFIADDLDVIATDTRKRVMAKQPPMPEPQVLHCPNLPPRAMADLLHVCDFVKAHATCLNVESFPLLHLAFALGLDDGSLLREIHVTVPTGGRTVMDITEPSPYFLREYLMYFLRTLFFREARSGEMIDHSHFVAWATRGVELGVSAKWREVFAEWSDVLNPLTVSEILRRYLHAHGMPEDAWMMDEITDLPASFSPYGESFLADRELLENTKEALETKTFDDLAPDHMLAVYRHLCDQLLDRPMIHEFIMSRTDYVNEMSFKLIEAEKEFRKAKKELNKGLGPGKEKDPLAVGREAGKLDPTIRALTDRMQLAHENLVKMQQASEEAEKGMRRVKLQPLGEDRFRNQYWYMEDEPRLYVHLKSMNVTGLVVPVGFNKKLCPPPRPLGGEWGVYTDEASVVQLIESLNQRALREGHLGYNLQVHFQHMRIAFTRAAKMREQYNPTPLPSMDLDNKSQNSEEASRRSSRVGARRSMLGDDEEEGSMDVSTFLDDDANASVAKEEPMDESASVVSDLRLDESISLDVPPPVDKVKRGRSVTSVKSAPDENDDAMVVGDAVGPQEGGALPLPSKETTRRGRSIGGNGGQAGGGAQQYVPMRPPHLITFEEVVDPIQCFRAELLSIEKEVWEAIKDSSLLRMCTTGTVEHRRDWLGAVDHASEATQLIEPLLQLEALFAQAMGFDNAVDEAIRLYNLLPSKKKRKPEPGEKKRRGRKPKASTIRKRTLAAQALLKQQQAEEAAAAAALVAAAEEEQKDAMEVEGENGDDDEEGDEEDEEGDEEGDEEEGDEEGDDEEDGDEDEEEDEEEEEEEEEDEGKADDTKSVEAEKPKAAVGQKRAKGSIGKKKGGRPAKRARGSDAVGEAVNTTDAPATGAANGTTPAAGEEGAAAPGAIVPSEEDQKTTNEICFINGPLSSIGREVWRAEVEQCKSVSAVALSLYAFSRRAQYELPRLRTRVVEVTQRERQAKESVKNGLDGDLLSLPTMECLNVVWAKLPNNKGPYWPAIVHIPYSRSLRRLLREKNHHLIRFIGETPIYHLSRVGQLPFLNEQGNIPAENRGRGKAMAKALKVAHQLWARQLEKQKESFGMPFEGDDWGEEEEGEETEDEEDEQRARARASLSSTDTEGEEGYPRKRTSRGARGKDRKSTDASEAGSNGGGRASKGRRR